MEQRLAIELAVLRDVGIERAGDGQRRSKLGHGAARLRQQRQRVRHIEHAHQVFRALQVAAHPKELGSGT